MQKEEQIQKRLNSMPSSYQNTYRKALSGKSKAAGVKAKCLDCCCWEREEVKNCQAVACPLHSYRPYQSKLAQNKRLTSVLSVETGK